MKDKNNIQKFKITFILICCFMMIFISNILNNSNDETIAYMDERFVLYNQKAKIDSISQRISAQVENNQFIYLSDIKYQSAKVGWGSLTLDKTSSNTQITLMIEGRQAAFKKGIFAHANSQIIYDISNYDYKYFTTYVGLNTTSASGDGVKFFIFTSEDGKDWGAAKYEEIKLPRQEASFVKIELENANYIKLIADQLNGNGSDHSVYADAKLTNNDKELSVFPTPEEYDEIIKRLYNNQNDVTGELEFTLLKRKFVSSIGNYTLNTFYNESADNKAVIDWLMSNQDVLRYYILGGKPLGNDYYKSLTELSRLYRNYKEDFENTEITKYGTVLGDLYTRMAIAMSLTHSQNVGLWLQSGGENSSDAVRRYQIYKDMHKNGNFVVLRNEDGTPKLNEDGIPELDVTQWFENYSIEEMRYIFNNLSDDEETLWLNEYTQSFVDQYPNQYGRYLSPHPYMDYRWENLNQPEFYDPSRKDEWDAHFKGLFSKYNVTYRPGLKKIWMLLRNPIVQTGAVCGGISKVGSSVRTSHGIPCVVIGQPGHAAMIYYWQDENGNGYWNLDNDVSGWTLSEKGERLLLGWGDSSSNYARGSYQVVYMLLAQEALNDYENLVKAEELVMLADAYKGDLTKQEEIYKKALEIQNINVDAWLGLINVYNQSETKTQNEYFALAEELAEDLKYFPLPMQQLTNLIKPKLTTMGNEEQNVQNSYKFTLLQTRILTEGTKTPNNTKDNYYVYQPSITRLEANYLLGKLDKTIATFSFDGEDAGCIVLASRFNNVGVRWDYSLDGKQTWHEVSFSADEKHKLQLTEEEINSITSENDIYVHIVGVNYSDENLYKIDILESVGLPSTLYANDWENKLIGAVSSMQWKFTENDEWTYYSESEPDLTGDKDVIVKAGATGVYLASTTSTTYHFTEDNQPNTRKYIPVSHLSIHSVSSEATGQGRHAINAIDANIKTNWHSAWDGSDRNKTIVIKLDEPKNLSALEYFPAAGGNGKILDAVISVSMDGENWTEVVSGTNWTYTNTNDIRPRSVDFEPTRGQYIKIVGKRTQAASSSMSFMVVSMFNFYEDISAKIVAEFSFDGNNAGRISLFDEYKNKSWKYSIDGGTTWKEAGTDNHQLSAEELNQINEENKIKILFDGDETQYKINIKKGNAPQRAEYVNDLENRLIGISNTNTLEWKIDDGNWTSYEEKEPVVTGSRTLYVRTKATGIYTASDSVEYEFTEDNQPSTAKYIPVKHLSIAGYSTQSVDSKRPYYAPNVIDGNINTLWHTDFRYSVLQQQVKPFISIKLDEPKYISALEFVQKKYKENDPDYIKNGIVYVSMDGEEWIEAGRIENCPQDTELRRIVFDESIQGQYVKLEMDTYGIFASAAMINLFEDKTKDTTSIPTAEIEYSTKKITNKDVVVTLVNPSTDITIENNNGSDTYTFTENGEFTFEFVDVNGNKGTATANVDWIDKDVPTAEFEYSKTENTIDPVTVTLKPSEEVTITNNNGSDTYIFTENGEFTFEFVDKAGNKGTATANVDWIKEPTKIKVTYSKKEITNEDVTATITSENSKIEVLNNNGSNSYTFVKNGIFNFEYIDEFGVSGNMTVMVDWIDKEAPTAEFEYSTTENTVNPVTVTLKPSEKVTITNNNGNDTYTFTENGEFTFEFVDEAGNRGEATANVDWIKVPTKVNIEYDIKTLTNKDVVATLKSENSNITIDNNNGSNKYTFTKNGDFTFEYTDEYGQKGKITANVDWIDKEAPTAIFDYNIKQNTANPVRATLIPSEEITILNNDGKDNIIFNDNGSFTFEFVDKAGNKGTATANVDWIRKIPGLEFVYSTHDLTNEDVEVKLVVTNVNITITNNNGSNTYVFTKNGNFTFEYIDEYGQKGQTTARVDWIDKEAPTVDIKYNKTTLTNQNVIATLKFSEDVTIINEDLKYTKNEDGTYTIVFEKNSKHCLEFEDKVGNKGKSSIDIDWIDKEVPIVELEYSTKNITLDPVTVTLKANEKITILNNNGSNTYTFNENGEFTFEFEDEAGNRGTATANVNWIRKTLKVKLIYSIDKLTNKDVVVTLVTEDPDEYINITNNNGSNTYTFTENGEFTFEYVGGYGIPNSITAKVDWIDKTIPTAKVEYDITSATKENVISTIKFDKKVKPLTEDAYLVEYENNIFKLRFEQNSNRIIDFVDEAGNKVTVTLNVDWIDKEIPTANVKYNTTEATNEAVDVEIKFSEDVIILNQDLDIIDIEDDGTYTIRFNENGKFTIEFVDKAGNRNSVVVNINNIDRDIPTAEVTYNTTELTNKDVTATIKFNEEVEILTEGLEIENKGNNTYELKVVQNGTYIVEFMDKAGNKGTVTVEVNNIDKKVPTAEVTYNTTEITNKEVIATIKFNEEVEITTKDVEIEKIDSKTYIVKFRDNDTIVIGYKDQAGNVGSTTLKVDWIQILPNINVSYDITTETKENVTVTITADDVITITNNEGKNTYTFTKNGEFIFEYIDKYGNKGKVITKVDWITKDTEKPVNPEKPVEPIKPSEDEKDKPSQEHNQVNQNNPVMNNQIGYITNSIYEANASEKVNNNLNENDYNYSVEDILVKISSKQDIKNATLINKKLIIDKEFGNTVGKASEYFELYLENGNKDRLTLEFSNMSIRFKLDSSKVFKGIYKVNDDNTLEKVEYEVIDDEYIMVNTDNLGKYILSYDDKQEQVELQPDNKIDTLNEVEKSTGMNKFMGIAIITIIVLIVLVIIFVVKMKHDNDE